MKWTTMIATAVLAVFVCTATVDAAPDKKKPNKPGKAQRDKKKGKKGDADAKKKKNRRAIMGRKLADLDTNGDKALSLDEFIADLKGDKPAAAEKIFNRLDTNSDKSVTREELKTARENRKKERMSTDKGKRGAKKGKKGAGKGKAAKKKK